MRPLLFILTGILCLDAFPTAPCRAETLADMYEAKRLYENELQKREQERRATQQEMPRKYVEALQRLERSFQISGELKPLLAVRDERERFEAEPDLARMTVLETPAKLEALQKRILVEYRETGLNKARAVLDLNQKYVQHLETLQKELTRQNKIDDAMEVMAECERAKGAPEVKRARFLLAAEGAPIAPPQPSPPGAKRLVDLDLISAKLQGEVLSWNSVTREITLRYDFQHKDQAADWEGPGIDHRNRLGCDQAVATFKPVFEDVSQIAFDGYYYSGAGRISVSLGAGLTAQLAAGKEQNQHVLFQHNEHHPVKWTDGTVTRYLAYPSHIMISQGRVTWKVNDDLVCNERLPQPIRYPTQVVLGDPRSHTTYDNVVITGVLTQGYLDALVAQ